MGELLLTQKAKTKQAMAKNSSRGAYSEAAISKALRRDSIQYPLVLYPGAIGLLGGAATLVLGNSVATLSLLGIGTAVGMGTWATNFFFRRDTLKGAYIRRVHAAIVEEREQRMAALKGKLIAVSSEAGLGQLDRLQEKFELLQRVLAEKLAPGELTYERYLCMAEQVYLSALDNLQAVGSLLESVQAIDETFIRARLIELNAFPEKNNVEIESLEERLALLNAQLETANSRLAMNEKAMTKIDLTTAALAAITTKKGHANVDMETAMTELGRMADRAQSYSK